MFNLPCSTYNREIKNTATQIRVAIFLFYCSSPVIVSKDAQYISRSACYNYWQV